ncbi:hypothetical protein BDZ45DRAFT_540980, partial [Acephala macrosclerotiorum]
NMLNICLIGSIGVSAIAFLVLEKSKRAKVTSVLRSNFDIVQKEGFGIDLVDHDKLSRWRPTTIVSSIEGAGREGPFDFVVDTAKALPDIYSVPDIIRPLVTLGNTSIVLIQNVFDIEIPIITAFPSCTVMLG